jgi:hypothetical protein
MANAGADAWDAYCVKMQDLYWDEYRTVRDKLHISIASDHDGMSAADRSAFAYTLDDYIKRGIPTTKKKGKRK